MSPEPEVRCVVDITHSSRLPLALRGNATAHIKASLQHMRLWVPLRPAGVPGCRALEPHCRSPRIDREPVGTVRRRHRARSR